MLFRSIPFVLGVLVIGFFLTMEHVKRRDQQAFVVQGQIHGNLPVAAVGDSFDAIMLDVGQGDSVLLLSEGHAVLVDCGEREYASTILERLRLLGVKSLDALITSHAHSDHMGSASAILAQFPVRSLYLPMTEEESRLWQETQQQAQSQNCEVKQMAAGDVFRVGKLEFNFLWPLPGDYPKEVNNSSYLIQVNAPGIALLFTGDLEAKVEREMLRQGTLEDIDVLKVGHHGSRTSTTEGFLQQIKPEYALIGVGEGNQYGHPHTDILSRLQQYGVEIFRTDVEGDIWVDVGTQGIIIEPLGERLAA